MNTLPFKLGPASACNQTACASSQPQQHPPGTRCGAGSSHTAPGTRCRCRTRPQPPAAPASAAAGTRTRPAARQGRAGEGRWEEGCVRQWGWEAHGWLQHGSVLASRRSMLAWLLASPAVPAAPPHTWARRMPRPPPPAVALIMMGKPIWLATCAWIVGAMLVGPVWFSTLLTDAPIVRRVAPAVPATAASDCTPHAQTTSPRCGSSQRHQSCCINTASRTCTASSEFLIRPSEPGTVGTPAACRGQGRCQQRWASRVTAACDRTPHAAAAAASRALAGLGQHAQHAQHKAAQRRPSWCRERWTCRP